MTSSIYDISEKSPLVSVIVPIYNTERFLNKCLDSLVSQTLKNIEFILVDDGSSDSSGKICDKYASADPRFKVIHKKNGGSASARQVGLDASIGDYIIVCDSDDWAESNMYELLYKKAEETNADIVCCGYITEYDNGKSKHQFLTLKQHNGIVDNLDLANKYPGLTFCKLIRRDFLRDNRISYDLRVNLGEDKFIMYKLLLHNPKIVLLNEVLYHYRRSFGSNSYTNNLSTRNVKQGIYIYNWLEENYVSTIYEDIIYTFALNISFSAFRAKDPDKDFIKRFLKENLKFKNILKHNLSTKSIVIMCSKILPIPLSVLIINKLYPLIYK